MVTWTRLNVTLYYMACLALIWHIRPQHCSFEQTVSKPDDNRRLRAQFTANYAAYFTQHEAKFSAYSEIKHTWLRLHIDGNPLTMIRKIKNVQLKAEPVHSCTSTGRSTTTTTTTSASPALTMGCVMQSGRQQQQHRDGGPPPPRFALPNFALKYILCATVKLNVTVFVKQTRV
jgi:hypothetical protein